LALWRRARACGIMPGACGGCGMMLVMPKMLTPDLVRFELRDGAAVVRLLAEQPPEAAMDGWSLMNRTTLCVVDGPGDAGYLFPRIGLDVPEGWDEVADKQGGAFVVFGATADGGLFARAT
jgi:hypothetical protein